MVRPSQPSKEQLRELLCYEDRVEEAARAVGRLEAALQAAKVELSIAASIRNCTFRKLAFECGALGQDLVIDYSQGDWVVVDNKNQ